MGHGPMNWVAVALVDSLLTAMVRANGDALVMHVGEKPIVVARSRSIDLSSHGLNLNAMVGMLAQLLPADAQASLAEFGAVEHRLPPRGSDHFTVVAARGGDDIWIEIRRRREESSPGTPASVPPPTGPGAHADEPVAEPPVPPAPDVAEPSTEEPTPAAAHAAPPATVAAPVAETSTEADVPSADALPAADVSTVGEALPAGAVLPVAEAAPAAAAEPVPGVEPVAEAGPSRHFVAPRQEPVSALEDFTPESASRAFATESGPGFPAGPGEADGRARGLEATPGLLDDRATSEVLEEQMASPAAEPAMAQTAGPSSSDEAVTDIAPPPEHALIEAPQAVVPVVEQEEAAVMPDTEIQTPMTEGLMAAPPAPEAAVTDVQPVGALTAAGGRAEATAGAGAPGGPGAPPPAPGESSAAAFVPGAGDGSSGAPLTRTVRIEVPARSVPARTSSAERLLRLAVESGATELFLMTQARPYLRVGGEVRLLQDEPVLSAAELDAVLADITPEPSRDAVSRGDRAEWLVELADVGRVRCASFRDHRGPGAVFHLLSTRAATVDQLGLEADARALASEPDGLVIVAGPAGSDKSAILAAFVDEINRHRADYLITIEPCVYLVHENVQALVSQREVGTDPTRAATATRAALNENPDVLVIDDLASGDVAVLAVQAASQGRLVLVSLEAGSTAEAVQRLIELVPVEKRSAVRDALARTFRGAIAQQLLRKSAGGRVAARELLMGTGAVARVLADHARADVVAGIEAACGGTPLADAVAGYVKAGVVDVREAFRKAPNRERLVSALRAAGVSTASIDRLQ